MSKLKICLCLAVIAAACNGAFAQQDSTPPAGPDEETSSGDLSGGSSDADNGTAGGGRRRGQGAGALVNGKHKRGGRIGDVLAQRADADPLEVRVAFRRAKTLVMERDPELSETWRQAQLARTDVGKRQLLRQYYTRLYADVKKADPSPALAAHVKILALISKQVYDPQRRAISGEEELLHGRGRGH